jgi:hypothetical protein
MTPSAPALKPAALKDRTIVAVEDQGRIIDLSNTRVLLDSFFDRGIKHLLVTPNEPVGTHWWMLRMASGFRVAYIGTLQSFQKLTRFTTEQGAECEDGIAHLFEFGRNGRVQ